VVQLGAPLLVIAAVIGVAIEIQINALAGVAAGVVVYVGAFCLTCSLPGTGLQMPIAQQP